MKWGDILRGKREHEKRYSDRRVRGYLGNQCLSTSLPGAKDRCWGFA